MADKPGIVMHDAMAVRQVFEEAAGDYDQHAVLQREIASRLLERLEFCRYQPGVVLDLGCASGGASRELARRFPQAHVLALDWSENMLAQLGPDPESGPLGVCADMHVLPLAASSVDLVFSNLAVSWARDASALFSELRRIMKPEAMLIFTCFGPDTLTELKTAWRSVGNGSPLTEFPDMHDTGDVLLTAGYREPVMDAERLVLEYPDLQSLIAELELTGLVQLAGITPPALTGKAQLAAVFEAYDRFCEGGRFPASFEIIYGTAFAPAEGQPMKTSAGDVATFSVDSLRSGVRKKA